MLIHLDQMFSVELAERLAAEGHDVLRAAAAGQQRADDASILQTASEAGRVLVTLDEHFGDWTVLPLSRHPGVIRVKAHPATTGNVSRVLLPFLARHTAESLGNHLVIVAPGSVRWIRTAEE